MLRAFIIPVMALAPSDEQATALAHMPTAASAAQATTLPAALPSAVPAPTPPPQIIGYRVHVVEPDDTLSRIAINGGSDATLIQRYNRLHAMPRPGRPLLIPHLSGQISVLPDAPLIVERGRTDRPWIALTFDAGAGAAPVPHILRTLRQRDVKITFFLTGTWIKENPDLTRQIVADGHEVANHSLTHPDLRELTDAQIAEELAETERLMRATTGASTRPLFRPPYGAYDERVLRTIIDQGYLPIYWTLDSLDSVGEPKTPTFLLDRVTSKLAPEELRGAIILVHCGSTATAEALPAILDRFAELGLEVRTLSEVL